MKRARGSSIGLDSRREGELWRPFLVTAILLRLLLTISPAYGIDMGGYVAWSRYLAVSGPEGFYETFHVVYAPLFQYCLWFSGLVTRLFHLSDASLVYLVKLWSVLADMAGAWLLIRHAQRIGMVRAGYGFGLFYLLNPAVLFNASIWGQFDGIPAVLLLSSLLLFMHRKPVPAALLFLAAVLVKPQSGLLAPLVLVAWLRETTEMDWRRMLRAWGLTLAGGIVFYLSVVLPFYTPTSRAPQLPAGLDPFWWLFDLYLRSVQDYPFDTANAWNLWTLLGGQTRADNLSFLGISHMMWGLLLLLPFGLLALWLYPGLPGRPDSSETQKMPNASDAGREGTFLPLSAWMLLFAAFLFMTKMHERYLVPALLIGTCSAMMDRRLVWPLAGASLVSFFNQLTLYRLSFSGEYWLRNGDPRSLAGALCLLVFFGWTVWLAVDMKVRSVANPPTGMAGGERTKSGAGSSHFNGAHNKSPYPQGNPATGSGSGHKKQQKKGGRTHDGP